MSSNEKRRLYCKEWARAYRERLKNDPVRAAKLKIRRDKYYLENKEKRLLYQKEYYVKNGTSCRDIEVCRQRQRNYKKKNRAICNSDTAKYKADKIQRTPKWLTKFDLDYIRHLYIQAKELESLDGIKRHVDHIIPLRGKNVSGLHVPWNLEIITAEENIRKGNRI